MVKIEAIKDRFKEKKGVLTIEELKLLGLNQYSIGKLISNRVIERVKRGKYLLCESQENEYFLIQQIIPLGIVCLLSAASIYDYTTHIPKSYNLAIKSNYYPSLPEYPSIKLYYWRKKQYELGIESILINGLRIKLYDKEKTVCDFLKFRNKLEKSTVKEVVKAYLKDEERDLVKLKYYSKELNIESILNNYMEILL